MIVIISHEQAADGAWFVGERAIAGMRKRNLLLVGLVCAAGAVSAAQVRGEGAVGGGGGGVGDGVNGGVPGGGYWGGGGEVPFGGGGTGGGGGESVCDGD